MNEQDDACIRFESCITEGGTSKDERLIIIRGHEQVTLTKNQAITFAKRVGDMWGESGK